MVVFVKYFSCHRNTFVDKLFFRGRFCEVGKFRNSQLCIYINLVVFLYDAEPKTEINQIFFYRIEKKTGTKNVRVRVPARIHKYINI
jgi:hypothetical protein